MRLQFVAVAALALICCAGCKDSELPPNPARLIQGSRSKLIPFRFALTTDPQYPHAEGSTRLQLHVTDGNGVAVAGASIQADVSMPGAGFQHATFEDRGGGNYDADVELNSVGTWDVDVTASQGETSRQERLTLEVGG